MWLDNGGHVISGKQNGFTENIFRERTEQDAVDVTPTH
jgi:hypothetical protein